MALDVRLSALAFDPAAEVSTFTASHPGAGALVTFLGQVRGDDTVQALELRHYAPLTLPGMNDLAALTQRRWALDGLLVLHRIGVMSPGEPIVLVAAAACHRRDAFAAVDFAMDNLKSESWFWKREQRGGEWTWIEPRVQDYADLARWDQD